MNFNEYTADLSGRTQPITGWLPDGRYIDIPLVSHIVDNLYVGGCMHGVDLGDNFSHVFSLYPWERYAFDDDTILEEVKMYDAHGGHDGHDLDGIVDRVIAALEQGGNVLVHCQAGINRSNLIAGLVLKKWKGMTGQEAVDLLRSQRSELVLANKSFLAHILKD